MISYVYRHKRKFFLILSLGLLTICQLIIPSFIRISHSDQDTFTIYEPINDSTLYLQYNVNDLSSNDLTTLIDLPHFKFIINNFPCNQTKKQPFLLILIHSSPSHVIQRDTIRNTWGREHDSICLLFFLGSVNSTEMQQKIYHENDHHRDIVQGNFYDSYRNLTYKHVMALKWAIYYCPGAKYIFKGDDDIFINTPYMLKYLSQAISPWGARKLMLCSVCPYCYVKRTYRSKWRVSPLEYQDRVYPPFCFGFAIIYSPDVIFELYKEAQQSKYFWIDDVHITGVIAARRNLSQSSFESLLLTDSQMHKIIDNTLFYNSFLLGPAEMSISLTNSLWNIVERANVTTL